LLEKAADTALKAAARVQSVQSEFERNANALVRMLSEALAQRMKAEIERQRAAAEDKISRLTAQHDALAAIARDAGSFAATASTVNERRTASAAVVFLRSAAFWRLSHGYGPDARIHLDPAAPEHVPPRLRDSVDPAQIDALLGLTSVPPVATAPAAQRQGPRSPPAALPTQPRKSSPVLQPTTPQSAAPAPAAPTAAPGGTPAAKPPVIGHTRNVSQPSAQQQPPSSVAQQRFPMRQHATLAVIGRPSGDPLSLQAGQRGAEADVVALAPLSLRPLTLRGEIEHIAGSSTEGMADGAGKDALFSRPGGIALDRAAGVLYIADSRNNCIRRLRLADKYVDTVAGCSTAGNADGIGVTEARFNQPTGIAFDSRTGLLYVADRENHLIRTVDPAANFRVTTLVGSGWPGLHDGMGHTAQLNRPWGLCVDGSGALYVADHGNHAIRRVEPSTGAIATLARVGKISGPAAVAVDAEGSLYICEAEGRTVRKLARGAIESTVLRGCASASGAFTYPSAIAVDAALAVYIADWGCDRVKRVDQRTGNVELVPLATLNKPIALAIGPDSQLFVADWHSVSSIK